MQTIWKRFHEAYSSRGCQVALLSLLTILLFAATANAVAQTSIIISQKTAFGTVAGGTAMDGGNPAGGTMAVNSQGVVVAGDGYGGDIMEFAPPTYAGVKISPAGGNNVSAVAIDSSNYLFLADQYSSNIVKVPMNADGTYTITVNPSGTVTSLPVCTGDAKAPDTAGECLISNPATALGVFGVNSMIISPSGNLIFATDANLGTPATGTVPYTIFECNALCLYGTKAPTQVFAETVTPAGAVATSGQYFIGGMALDAYGNLFFTDSAVEDGNLKSLTSNLWEMPVASKAVNPANTGFTAAPIQVLTMTNTGGNLGDYDNAINSVAADTSGRLYVGVLYSGLYGLVDNLSLNGSSTGAQTALGSSLYGIANQVQAKFLATDGNGNFYELGNGSSKDTLYFVSTGPIKFSGAETVGTAEDVSVVVADNTAACTPSLTFTSSDSTVTGTSGACNGMFDVAAGSFTAVTLAYTPTVTGYVPSALTVNDTGTHTSSAPQVASSSGAAITISQGAFGAPLPAGGAWGSSSPDGHSGAVNSKGVVVFGDSYGNQVTMFTNVAGIMTAFGGAAATPGVAGTFNGAGGVAIDKNDNLFISSEYGTNVYKVAPNADGSYGPWTADGNSNPENAGGTAPVACVGGAADKTAGICVINLGAGNYNFGISSLAVDTNGNLFITAENQATNNTGTYAPNTVFECNTTCLYGASAGGIVTLFTEPVAGTNPQLIPGSIALDSSDNVYFTDSLVSGTEQSGYSDVYELKANSSNSDGYQNNPTLLANLTELCGNLSGCTYSTAITALSVDANGDVFFGAPSDGSGHIGGLWELVSSSGTLSPVPLAVSGESPKTIVPDGKGNFYFISYNNSAPKGDTAGFLTIGSVSVTPIATPGAPSTVTNVWAIDNGASCQSDQGNLSFTEAANDGFSAVETAGNNCTTMQLGSGASFPVSVTFTPGASVTGTTTTTLTATNSSSGDTGTASVTGQAATAQHITGFSGITSPATYGGGPYTLSATGGASGNPVVFSVDASSTSGIATVSGTNGTTLTISGVGTVVIDANQAGGTVGSVTYAPGYLQVMITVNPATQTIAFSPASPVSFGVKPITLSAAGGASGNPVVFTLDSTSTAGAATLSGSTLTVTGIGTIVIDANQAGNTNYAAAAQVQKSIVVNQGTQTITITAAPTTVVSPTTSTITATASSGLPVTLSLTSGSSIATLNTTTGVLTPTGTAFGNVVVTANQAGNTNYAAATAATVTVIVNSAATVATPTITPASGTLYAGSTNTITITDATANAVIWYTTDGTNPLNSGTAIKYTAPFTLAVSTTPYTVNAAATLLGDSNSVVATTTYTVSAVVPTFTLTANPPAVTVQPGQSAAVTIYLTPGTGFTLTTSFACSGVPSGVTCSFSPSSVTPTGTAAVSTVLTISNGTAALQRGPNPFLPGGVTFAIALGFLGWKKRRGLFLALVLIAGVICLTQVTGCGSSAKPSTTSTMTVTATSSAVTETLPIAVTVVQ